MGKIDRFCRICRSDKNLKFTTKQLREFNRNQRLTAEIQGPGTDKASQKLLRTTPTLGNICNDCDARVQIFHRLDDANQSGDSDIEVDVVDTAQKLLPPTTLLPALNSCRPDTPIIVDDDDMLYDLFMQKVDQQRHQTAPLTLQQTQPPFIPQQHHQQQQLFISHFNTQYTPPQSSAGGSEGDDAKILEVLTSREGTPASIATTVTAVSGPPLPPDIVDNKGHRIVAIIDLDDEDSHNIHDPPQEASCVQNAEKIGSLVSTQDVVVAQSKFQTEPNDNNGLLITPIKYNEPNVVANDAGVSEDDEEIVFRRVEPHLETPPSKKKKRKSYDEKQLRLVASLSLLSSDSETEEEPVKKLPKTTAEPAKTSAPTNGIKQSFICKECQIVLPDQESLSVHERVHEGIKCPECKLGFSQEKRLVHHMRCKHRTFNGSMLKETARVPQDSAMTIRLRYKQCITYYECQLCGRIDEVFKDHKDHIIKKHAEESKCLKDPIMKELKCPVCKAKCGAQYLSLCRHLLDKHEYGQYKTHLRELVHVSAFGWNAARQQEVAKTARIYQFSKRKSFFFECKICHKVVAGYLNHLKHTNSHNQTELEQKPEVKKEKLRPSIASNSKKISSNEKLSKKTKSTKNTKQILQKDSKSCKKSPVKKSQNLNKSLITKKSSIVVKLKKPVVKSKEILKTKSKETLKPKSKEALKSPKSKDKNKNKSKENLKTKSKESSKTVEKLINSKSKTIPQQITAKTNETKSNKRKRKELSALTKPHAKKVKVKAPIKQINLQTYTCNYCSKQIKGFLAYNAHVRQEHKQHEFVECVNCQKTYVDKTIFKCHTEQCSKMSERRKRKCVSAKGKKSKDNTDVNCITTTTTANGDTNNKSTECCEQQKVPEMFTNDLPASEKEPLWLKDLLKINESKNSSNSNDKENSSSTLKQTNTADLCEPLTTTPPTLKNSTQPCGYCLHLYASEIDLKNHTRLQHSSSSEEVIVRYKKINDF